jgi:phenylpropionate dioxygenase-like ring-hydroxylating dioxygenase large terminal subunit
VQETYGIVHAFFGDLPEQERPPLYDIVEFGQEGWRESEIMLLEIGCYYERSMENGLDPIHNEFVHPLQGAPAPKSDSLEITNSTWGTKVIGRFGEKSEKDTKDLGSLHSNPAELNAGSWTHGPNTLITWIQFSANSSLHQYFFEAPVDADHTKIFFVNLRNTMLEESYDERFKEANLKITREDIGILESLRPVRTPETLTKEVMTPGDAAIVGFRNHLKTWENNGWRIDRRALRENDGDIAFAIPCPERRTSGNWVIDPVPLMPPTF